MSTMTTTTKAELMTAGAMSRVRTKAARAGGTFEARELTVPERAVLFDMVREGQVAYDPASGRWRLLHVNRVGAPPR